MDDRRESTGGGPRRPDAASADDGPRPPSDGARARAADADERVLLAALVDASIDAIVGEDPDGRIVGWNRAAERLFGHPAASILGRPIATIVPTELRHEAAAASERIRNGETLPAVVTERLHRDGSRVPVSLSLSPIRGAGGRIVGAATVVRDLTPRGSAEDGLRERNRQLDLLSRTSQRLLLDDGADEPLLEAVFADIADVLGIESYYHYRPIGPRLLGLRLAGGIDDAQRQRFGTMRFGELLCGRVAETRARLIVEDLQHSDQPGAELLRAAGAASYAGFPLVAGGELVGTVAFVSSRRTRLRDGEVSTVQAICDQLAITLERRRLRRELREAEESRTFLLRLSDELRSLRDAAEIQATAARLLGDALRACRTAYFEIDGDRYVIAADHARAVPSLVGSHPVASFGADLVERLRRGEPVVVSDVRDVHDDAEVRRLAAIRVGAYLGVPLVKDGRFIAGLCVQAPGPRDWTPAELRAAAETAERTWAAVERARAEARVAAIRDALSARAPVPSDLAPLAETRAIEPATATAGGRRAALDEAALLDAPPSADFDPFTRLAAGVLRAPISLFSVVDAEHQHFVGAFGLPAPLDGARRGPLWASYCRFAIESEAPVSIHDAEHNPLVAGIGAWKDGFVAYLATPIRDREGRVVAALSVADSEPRCWTRRDLLTLEGIARLLAHELELRAALRDVAAGEARVRESEALLRTVLSSTPDLVWVKDRAGRITLGNAATYALLGGGDPQRVLGGDARSLVPEPDQARAIEENDARVLLQGETVIVDEAFTRDGVERRFQSVKAPLRDDGGALVGIVGVSRDVTRQKRAEDALRAAHDTFHHLVSRSPFGIYTVDADFRLAHVSEGARKVFENAGPLIGRDFADVIRAIWPQPFAGEVIGRFRDTLATGRPYHAPETVERRADIGVTEAYDWRLERITMPDGRPGVVCHFYDLSERQQYEQTLRVARTRLETALQASQVILFHQDRGLRYTWIHNPALGFAAPQVVGKQDAELLERPEDAARIEAVKRAVLGSGVARREEVCVVNGGTRRFYDLFVQPDRDADGTVVGVNCAAVDVTERHDAEAALRQAVERAAIAQEAAGAMLYEHDPRTGAVVRDAAVATVTGLDREALEPTVDGWLRLLHPDDARRAAESLRVGIAGGRGYALEYRLRHAAGRVVWVHDRARVFHDAAGRPERVVGMIVDITARKAIEEQLRQADRNKDEFLAMLAHELRNPLVPLRNGLKLLQGGAIAPEVLETARAMMERQLAQLVRLVDDLLDVSRISRGQIELRRAPVALAAIVESALEASRPNLEARGHDLVVELPDRTLRIDGDAARLAQVVGNLLNNAAKFTPDGGRVTVGAARDGASAVVVVTDTGVGIAAPMLERVFEMFTQVDATIGRAQGGLGIGLSLARELVELHGGTLAAASDGIGRGARFTIRLPLASAGPGALAPEVDPDAG